MTGYSGTPLIKKLGIKPGFNIMPVNEPGHYMQLLGDLPDDVEIVEYSEEVTVDFIHLFAKDENTLHNYLPLLKKNIKKEGMIWVSWIKGSSKIDTDISSNDVRRLGLEIGLVDIKVCAVDEDWSGLKFVYRKNDRR